MNHKYYLDYINSPEWHSVRERYFASSLPQVCWCCDKPRESGYHLHHKTYLRLGREYLSDLVLLCKLHHDQLHDYLDKTHLKNWEGTTRFINDYREGHNLPTLVENNKPLVQIYKTKRRKRKRAQIKYN